MRSFDMAALHYLARHEKMVAVLDLDSFVHPDGVLVRSAVLPHNRVVFRNAYERRDFSSGHLRTNSITLLKLPAIHEDVEPRHGVGCGHVPAPCALRARRLTYSI